MEVSELQRPTAFLSEKKLVVSRRNDDGWALERGKKSLFLPTIDWTFWKSNPNAVEVYRAVQNDLEANITIITLAKHKWQAP
jgi:hypothetical protein